MVTNYNMHALLLFCRFFDNYGDSISRFTPYSLNSTFGEYLSQTMVGL